MPHPALLKSGEEAQNGNGDSAKDAAQ
jgi:hypothetical protein